MSKSRQNSNTPNRLSVVDRTELLTKTGTKEGEVILQNDISLLYTWTDTQGIDNGGTIINVSTGSWIAKYSGAVNVKWFGAKGDGVTDDIVSIQSAINYVYENRDNIHTNLVDLPAGIYLISSSIKYRQSVNLSGTARLGGLSGGTEIKASDTFDITLPTDNYTGAYGVVLEKAPIIYNIDLITQQSISNIRFNGNGQDIYGAYFNEIYYYTENNVSFINFLNSPYTMVRGQFNDIRMLVTNISGGATRFICCSGVTIDGLDIEGSTSITTVLDVVQDTATKTGIVVSNLHYEEPAGGTPVASDLVRIAGKGIILQAWDMAISGTALDKYINLLGTGTSYIFDGVTISTAPTNGVVFNSVYPTLSTVKVKLGLGTTNTMINNNITIEEDLSGETSNRLSNNSLSRNTIVRASDTNLKMLHFTDDSTINFFDNSARKVITSGADMSIENTTGRVYLKSGASSGTSDIKAYGGMFDVRKKDGSNGDYLEGYFRVCGYTFWVDSLGVFRMVSGYPVSDTDGTVVGTQT